MSSGPQRVHRFVTSDLQFRAAAVIATGVVEEMRQLQNTLPPASIAVGRAMVGALLMASHTKEGEEVGLYFRGRGPLEMIFAEANFTGEVRGYTPQSQLQATDETMKIGELLGIGLLTVVRSHVNWRTPHRGTVEILSGEIGDDLAYYLLQSHQIPSVVSLGVRLDQHGLVVAAGGVLIESLPGTAEQSLARLEQSVKRVGSVSELIAHGASARDLAQIYLQPWQLEELDHPHFISYRCKCSLDRVRQAVACLRPEEIGELIEQDHGADMTCEFCGRKYRLEREDLQEIRTQLQRQSLH